jgi:hypothetical protein
MLFSLAAREKLRRPTTSQKTLSDLRCMAEISQFNTAALKHERRAS